MQRKQHIENNQPNQNQQAFQPMIALLVISLGVILLLLTLILSIILGVEKLAIQTVIDAIFDFQPQLQEHQIVIELRIPRAIGAAIVGCCFAVSGAIMQGMTRNPLADSGLLGLNAGAIFVLAICMAFFPSMPYPYLILFSFFGAAIGAIIVYGIGSLSRRGLTPVRLALAGAAVSTFLTALSEGIALSFRVGQEMAFWHAGGLSGMRWEQLFVMGPWLMIVLIGAFLLSRSITMLSLGEESAMGLGVRSGLVKGLGTIVVLILAGMAVSVVGAVSFVGLMVPHLSRWLVGHDYRWILPTSAILGAILVVLADVASRTLNPPYEVPIGTLIALLGVPFFLYLARRGGKA